MNQQVKICNVCCQTKSVTDFYFRKENGKYKNRCKRCCIDGKNLDRSKTTKKCKHCGEEKPFSEYQKAGGGKWLQPYCKPCDSKRKKEYSIKNSERLKEKYKTKYLKNKDKISEKGKIERLAKRPETLKRIRRLIDARKMSEEERKRRKSGCDRIYRENNKDEIKLKKKEYYDKFGLEKAKAWQKKNMQNIEFRTKKRLRGRIYVALKRGIKSESTMKLLGCSIENFKKYFESLFTDGMNWDIYLSGGIHIDHIIPCKYFDLTSPEQQKKCFHYTNLQPLWGLDNLKKGASIPNKLKVA